MVIFFVLFVYSVPLCFFFLLDFLFLPVFLLPPSSSFCLFLPYDSSPPYPTWIQWTGVSSVPPLDSFSFILVLIGGGWNWSSQPLSARSHWSGRRVPLPPHQSGYRQMPCQPLESGVPSGSPEQSRGWADLLSPYGIIMWNIVVELS